MWIISHIEYDKHYDYDETVKINTIQYYRQVYVMRV